MEGRPRIAEFRNHLLEKVSPQTANIDLKFVKAVFRAAKADGYVSESPAETVELFRRVNTRTRRTFTIERLRQVIEAADPEWRSMIRFGLYTGQRMGDLARLTTGTKFQVPVPLSLKGFCLGREPMAEVKSNTPLKQGY